MMLPSLSHPIFVFLVGLLPVADFLPQDNKLPGFLSQFISEWFQNSKIFLVYGNFFQDGDHHRWLDILEEIVSQREVISDSGGLTNFNLNPNKSDYFVPVRRPPRVVESEVAHLVLILIPAGIRSPKEQQILNERLNLPLLEPPTLRDMDKYIIVTEKKELSYLNGVETISKLKFKLYLTEGDDDGSSAVALRQFCPHCPIKEKIFLENDASNKGVSNYFPDFQLNYFGSVLRASSTDKMEGDLEFALDSSGKKYAKRGVFASAMYHLAEGLNFTAEAYPSSAGASTGHRLPNGTWVGSVGDVYNGDASFCMLCGMSYSRHSFVEICSPVTYEYIRFAIGPPDKLYTWQAIFWPFDGYLWGAFFASTVITALASGIFLRWDSSNSSNWNLFKVTQYLGKIFIEQVDDLPLGLPQSLKVILGYWLLFALVGTTIYRAKMVTFMTFPIYENIPLTYEELIESDYEIDFHYFPNIAYNSFKSSTNPVIKATFEKMLKQPDPIKCLQTTLTSKSVCIMFTSVHEDLLSRNMSDRFGISPIRSSTNFAFMFTPGISSQKRAPFTRNFRHILQTSLAMGLNEWWTRSDAYFLLKQKNTWIKTLPPGGNRTGVFQYNTDGDDDVLHLKHLKGAFTVIIGGLLICLAAFIMEQSIYIFGRITNVKGRWERTLEVAKSKNLNGSFTLKTSHLSRVVHFAVQKELKLDVGVKTTPQKPSNKQR